MSVRANLLLLAATSISAALISPTILATSSPAPEPIAAKEIPSASLTEVKVTLFGQPCILKGPFSASTLKNIHQLGPETVYVDLNAPQALKHATVILGQVSTLPEFPPPVEQALSPYRKKLTARLEALIAYLNGLEKLRTSHDPKNFLKAVSGHLKGSQSAELEKMATSLAQAKKFDENLAEFFEAYNQQVEPDPENDFHRAIKQLDVRYNCAFDNFTEGK